MKMSKKHILEFKPGNHTVNFMDKRIQKSISAGLKRGWSGYIWLMRILIPISFGTALLIHSGWLYKADFIIQPVMGFLSLPASAALPLIIGIFTGIYGAVGAMAAMPLTLDQMTLIAVFLLISHNLIQESMVQGQSGLNPFVAALFRLTASVVVTFIVSILIQPDLSVNSTALSPGAVEAGPTLSAMLKAWAWDFTTLAAKIFSIIMPLMVMLELMKTFNLIQHTVRLISPLLAVMGLSRSTGVLWLTAATFGLSYGAAVIVHETRNNTFSKDELTRLHLSIGINHAMVEDPALFLPLGIPPFWLWIPRLGAAVLTIYFVLFINLVRRFHAGRTGNKKFCNH